MVEIICKYPNGTTRKRKACYTIGDIVQVVKPGNQYTTYRTMNKHFFGSTTGNYHIPYEVIASTDRDMMFDEIVPTPSERWKQWKVANGAVNRFNEVIYHIRDKNGNNSVVDAGALKLIRRPSQATTGIATFDFLQDS